MALYTGGIVLKIVLLLVAWVVLSGLLGLWVVISGLLDLMMGRWNVDREDRE